MNIERMLKEKIIKALNSFNVTELPEISASSITIEHSKDAQHGDYATNIAMQLARSLKKNPREVAQAIVENIDLNGLDKTEIAGPGFINFFVKNEVFVGVVQEVINKQSAFGQHPDKNKRINLEFVSANPTGPLHIGHARGAAVGDSLARIFKKAGYDVTKEFYVNDAGMQIKNLGISILYRYLSFFGINKEIPEDGYLGQDIIDIADEIKKEFGEKFLHMPEEEAIAFLSSHGAKLELDRIKKDLGKFGVDMDIYSSELAIKEKKSQSQLLGELKKYTYTDEGALFLKTSEFLDDKDRVIVKSNGEATYFLPDIAYHLDKLERGYDLLIDVLGADHHGYLNRMRSSLMMFGNSKDVLDFVLIQMVRMMLDGEEVKLSKRSGNALTLNELCEEVGVDAVRYFMVARAPSSHLDFDIDFAKTQNSSNPVYYAQYAHARLSAILFAADDIEIDENAGELREKSEMELLKHLISYEGAIEDGAKEMLPQKIAIYINELAALIHQFYTECKIIDRNNIEVTSSRLALCKASQIVLADALNLIGVSAPIKM